MIFNTIAGPVKIMSPSEIGTIVPHEQIQYTNNPNYGYLKNLMSPPTSFSMSVAINTQVANFTTATSEITTYTNKEGFLLESLVKQLTNRVLNISSNSFEEAVQDAAVECISNFGTPTHAIVFNNNTMIMGEFESSSISFKEVSPNTGALVLYSPYKFNICKLPEACSYLGSINPKYDSYTQYILILETLKRLDLV